MVTGRPPTPPRALQDGPQAAPTATSFGARDAPESMPSAGAVDRWPSLLEPAAEEVDLVVANELDRVRVRLDLDAAQRGEPWNG